MGAFLIDISARFVNSVEHFITEEERETGEYADVSDFIENFKNDHQYEEPRQAPNYEQLRLEGHNSNMYEVCSPTYEEFSSGDQNQKRPILAALLAPYIKDNKKVILQQFQVDVIVFKKSQGMFSCSVFKILAF